MSHYSTAHQLGTISLVSVDIINNHFNLTINGAGYFRLTDHDYNYYLTRDGSFTLNCARQLVHLHPDGLPLADELILPPDIANLTIDETGIIYSTFTENSKYFNCGKAEYIGQLALALPLACLECCDDHIPQIGLGFPGNTIYNDTYCFYDPIDDPSQYSETPTNYDSIRD